MKKIEVKENCIACNKCVIVCPARVFNLTNRDGAKGEMIAQVNNPTMCIDCSHCVSVCPQEAIEHSSFPDGSLRDINFSLYPTPEQMLEVIEGRHSNRAFSKQSIDSEKLGVLKRVVTYSPTASNSRNVECIIITDAEKLKQITEFTLNQFYSVVKLLENPFLKPVLKLFKKNLYAKVSGFKMMVDEYKKGNDLILRGATAVIFFYAPYKSRFKVEDTNLAYQNVSLMATSMNLAHFYTGFVCAAVKLNKQKKLNALLGIDAEIHAGMALGNQLFPIVRTRK